MAVRRRCDQVDTIIFFIYIQMKNLSFVKTTLSGGRYNADTSLSQCWKSIKTKLTYTQMENPTDMHGAGLLNFLTSAKNNTAGRLDIRGADMLNKGDGKNYSLIRRFYPKQAPTQNKGGAWQFCKKDGTAPSPYYEDHIRIRFEHFSDVLKIDHAMLRCIEEDAQTYENDAIQEHLQQYLRDFGSAVSRLVGDPSNGYIGGHAGNLGDANGSVDLPMLNSKGTAYNPAGIIAMQHYLELARVNPNTVCLIGGSGKMSALARLGRYLSCSSCSAVDNAVISNDVNGIMLKDQYIGRLLGDPDCVLAIVPGALRLVTKVDFVGNFTTNKESMVKNNFVDPWFGLRHDVVMWEDDCDKEKIKTLQYHICYDVFGYPSCQNLDPCFANVNDVFKFKLTCSDDGVCNLPTLDDCNPIGLNTPKTDDCASNTVVCQKPCEALFAVTCNDDGSITYKSASCGATGNAVVNLAYTFENDFVVEGVPTDEIAVEGITGTIDEFTITDLTLIGDSGTVELIVTDSAGNTCDVTACATCKPVEVVEETPTDDEETPKDDEETPKGDDGEG